MANERKKSWIYTQTIRDNVYTCRYFIIKKKLIAYFKYKIKSLDSDNVSY
jgi:hypothetical protein